MAVKVKEMLITPNKWSRPQTKIGKIKSFLNDSGSKIQVNFVKDTIAYNEQFMSK